MHQADMAPGAWEAKAKRHPCCRPGYRGELCSLYEALVSRRELFSRDGCLNSDGRRLLETLLRLLLEERPEYRRLVRRVRRSPCLEELARLAGLSFYACDPLEPAAWLRTL